MTQDFSKISYMIVLTSEVDQVDFSQVFETSPDTIRISVDGIYTFFKWEGDVIPSSIEALSYKDGEYKHYEILDILNSPEWTSDPDL
jgi:di/tripeptidase